MTNSPNSSNHGHPAEVILGLVEHDPHPGHCGRRGVVEVAALESWWKAASDVHLEILEMGETDGLVTLRYTLTGTNDGDLFGIPASGERFHVENCTLLRVIDGKVKNAYRYSDTLGLMTQLGAIPARD